MRFICLLLCMLVFPFSGCAQEENWYIRIIARDDTPAAQQEKLALRDQLLPLFPKSREAFPARLPLILLTDRRSAPCRIRLLRWAPHKNAPPLPTVCITLGKGDGRNWWGLLYADAGRFPQALRGEPLPDAPGLSWPWLRWLCSLFDLGGSVPGQDALEQGQVV